MKYIKQFSMAFLAVAATAASAAVQPINTVTSSTVNFDVTKLSANNYTASALGNATYNASTGVLKDSVANVSITGTSGPATVAYDATSGIALSTTIAFVGTVNVNLTKFSYNFLDNTLYGDVFVTALGSSTTYANQAILVAGSETGTLGTDSLGNLSSSASLRDLNMNLGSFTLAPDLSTKLKSAVSFVSWLPAAVTSVNVFTKATATTTIPEPSTYALLGLGLVGISLVARRKQA